MTNNIFLYIGPGMSWGVIAAVLGILLSIIVALFAIVWYPIKRIFKLFFSKKNK